MAHRDNTMRDPVISRERGYGQCEMPRAHDERRACQPPRRAGDETVVTAMRVEHVECTAAQERLDTQHRLHVAAAAHACVMNREPEFSAVLPETRIARANQFDGMTAFP